MSDCERGSIKECPLFAPALVSMAFSTLCNSLVQVLVVEETKRLLSTPAWPAENRSLVVA